MSLVRGMFHWWLWLFCWGLPWLNQNILHKYKSVPQTGFQRHLCLLLPYTGAINSRSISHDVPGLSGDHPSAARPCQAAKTPSHLPQHQTVYITIQITFILLMYFIYPRSGGGALRNRGKDYWFYPDQWSQPSLGESSVKSMEDKPSTCAQCLSSVVSWLITKNILPRTFFINMLKINLWKKARWEEGKESPPLLLRSWKNKTAVSGGMWGCLSSPSLASCQDL